MDVGAGVAVGAAVVSVASATTGTGVGVAVGSGVGVLVGTGVGVGDGVGVGVGVFVGIGVGVGLSPLKMDTPCSVAQKFVMFVSLTFMVYFPFGFPEVPVTFTVRYEPELENVTPAGKEKQDFGMSSFDSSKETIRESPTLYPLVTNIK